MDQAQGAAGTGEAEQPTSRNAGQTEEKELSPLQAAVRGELGLEGQRAEGPAAAGQTVEPKVEAEPEQPEVEEEQPAEDLPAEAEPEGEDGEHDSIADQIAAAEAKGEKPAWYLSRIANEARKKRERTEERDQWKETAEKLHAQLQQATTQQLQPTKVLSEVVDKQSLAAAEAHWKEIRRFARTNPDGAEDVFIGKDAAGNEIRRDYTRDEIIKMGLDADEAIEALPQKRTWVAESEAQTEVAKKVYPDLFKDTEAGREAAAIVQMRPWILQVEDYALVIGDYQAGRKMRLAKQGKAGPARAGLSPGAQAILGAPKVTPAPGVIKSRSASGGPAAAGPGGRGPALRDVDSKKANEEFYAKGMTNEALEEKIARKLEASQAGRQGGKQAALV
jgi:hypothetical protein